MTGNGPPRLALSLLSRWLPDDDPLVGDLLEEFAAGRGRLWFWRQTVSAVEAAAARPRVGVRPLTLVAGPGRRDPDPTPPWPERSGGPLAYLPASPVNGIGSLGILAAIGMLTQVVPQIGLLVGLSLIAGAGLGALLTARTVLRMHRHWTPAIPGVLLGQQATAGGR
jgi:hypothetical protein